MLKQNVERYEGKRLQFKQIRSRKTNQKLLYETPNGRDKEETVTCLL